MPLLVKQDDAAQALLLVSALSVAVGEVAGTYIGTREARATPRLRLGSLRRSIETGLLARNVGDEVPRDEGTKRVLLAGMLVGLGVSWVIAAQAPGLRVGANTWATEILGAVVVLLGVAVRTWGVATLGRYFQREVVIEEGQEVVTSGPYRWVRHPAYAGNLLTVFGFGLMFGSWVGAAAGLAISFLALLPRLRVEERVLRDGLGRPYETYASQTSRLLPGIW